jgi:hypothetical protein
MIRANQKFGSMNIKKILSIVLAFSLVLSVAQTPHVHATPIFGTALDLNTPNVSSKPNIAVSGNNVYVIYNNADDLFIKISTNNGTTFPTTTNISAVGAAAAVTNSDIAIGNHVYVAWQDRNNIFVEKNSTTSGAFSGTQSQLDGTAVTATAPKIAASGDNVWVVWKESSKVLFSVSSTAASASSFIAKTELSSSGADPQIVTTGSTAYVVWSDTLDSPFTGNIKLAMIASDGTVTRTVGFGNTTGASETPQIAVSGTTAYVVWKDSTPSGSNGDILFSKISDTGVISVNGTNLSSNSGTSSNPQIAIDGSDAYVTWQDDTSSNFDVLFKHSTDSGANFGSQVNLSNTTSSSTSPSIAVSGNNVNVVWQDAVVNTSTILFRSSPDKGATFGGLKNLSTSQTSSIDPQVVASDAKAYVTWESTVSSSTHAFVISGASSTKDIKFDLSQYASNTATITVRNSTTTADFVTAIINSTTSTAGVTLRLNETSANNGNFTGQIALTTESSSTGTCSSGCHLQTASGATLTATYLGQTTNAFMPTRTLSFGFSTYTLTDGGLYPGITIPSVILTLDDTGSDTSGSQDTVDVTVTSTSQSSGITLRLTETGANTHIFRNSKLIFTTGTAQYSVGDALTITVDRTGEPGTLTTASATVASTTSPLTTSPSRAFLLNLTETGTGTEIFTGTLNLAATTNTATNTIGVTAGDILSITNSNSETTNALIIPNSNSTIGAVRAAAGDTITATSSGTTATATISSGPGSGGGGGGVVHPTVIVNVVAAASTLLGGSSSSAPPLIGSASLVSLGDQAQGLAGTIGKTDLNSISSTQTAKTGEKLSFQLDINNNAGIDYLTHVELGVNNKGLPDVASDTSIIYDKFKTPQITIIDPHKLFADAKFTIVSKDPRNGMLKFEVTFAKPMDTSDVRLLAWDVNRNFVQKYYEDALKIEKSDKTPLVEIKKQDKIDTNQIQQKIKPQKVIQKENQKDPVDKKTQKTEFDKLTKKTTDKKKTKNELVKKLQNKSFKTADKKKDSSAKKLQNKTIKTNAKTK